MDMGVSEINIKEKSYIYGLLGTDGNLYLNDRNRGKISLEVSEKDKDIVYKLYNVIPYSHISVRKRDTNFKKSHVSYVFSNHRKEFRDELISWGYPTKDKKNEFTIPIYNFSEHDFWRGVIDGDGSIGFTSNNEPYISLVIIGESLKDEYLRFLKDTFNIKKNVNRNKRDNAYNITLKNENAIAVLKYLYEEAAIFIDRKYSSYLNTLQWKRSKKKINRESWNDEDILFIQNHTIQESCNHLNRTESSIKAKLYRIKR